MDAWIQRCKTCRYAIMHKNNTEVECRAPICNYRPKAMDLPQSECIGTYHCSRCGKSYTVNDMSHMSFKGFDKTKYCKSCLVDYINAYNENIMYWQLFKSVGG